MKAKIIAISGPHGTGKTTAVKAMVAELKNQGASVAVVDEVMRSCPYQVYQKGQLTSEEAQIWGFCRHLSLELEAIKSHDIVVADRSIVDYIAYTSIAGFHGLAAAQIKMAYHHVQHYQRIIFRGIPQFDYLVDDGFRSLDPGLRLEVQARMLELYSELGVKVTRPPGA